jgi:Zn-dependent protease with chaperone function
VSGFTGEEIERSRRYHRPRYAALVGGLLLSVVTLVGLTWLPLPGPWWLAALLGPFVVGLALGLVRLPLAWWRYRHDVAWGFSTQTPRAWAVDLAKEAAVGTVLLVGALWTLFALAHWFPDGWPWIAAAVAALLVLLLGFVAPVLLEPIFNRFEPLSDETLAVRLRALAERAGAPVRAILVADASRRTTKVNAYVSGIGSTRRVVLWDTLLATPADQVAVVLAHELGHRVKRHVAIFTALLMAGAAGFVLVLRLVLPHPEPEDTALILLLALVLELAALPAGSALSRRFERTADRFSLDLTGDRAAYQALHHDLAVANLSDLRPPKWLYYWTFSHPTPPERLGST